MEKREWLFVINKFEKRILFGIRFEWEECSKHHKHFCIGFSLGFLELAIAY